jgi:uncharacterized membrane protein YgaE (UPF0421/DUF939 family)
MDRAGLDRAAARVRAELSPLVLTAIAAAAAWGIARQIPGHPRPIFAAIAAVVAMGAGVGHRGRQARDLLVGIVIGIGLAELVVFAFGKGIWQIGVAVFVGVAVQTALALPRLVGTQAAVWGVLVIGLPSTGGHPALNRCVDGLIGASVAILLAQILFPVDPMRLYRRAVRELRDALAGALDEIARGLRTRDRSLVEAAIDHIDAIDDRRIYDAVALARSVARRAPRRRHVRGRLIPAETVAHELTAAAAEARALATGALRLLDTEDAPLGSAADAVAALAAAIRTGDYDSVRTSAERAREAARETVRRSPSLGASVLAHAAETIAGHAVISVRVREENEKELAVTRRGRFSFLHRTR